ncbi:YceD family protein [Moraxella nasicaprae]|uniref:Large ribosomal RNA subunit accumulation protein YceD n=1 Tax=Moraxella nasicaprae TaxID=2904122 RepID=A0ABY6F5X3_9GAMM|nr:YceD family protein [Moraxella nasicaprae]UXZ05500.1 YceD family protein [Moraxella nasicaprae]
MMTDYPENSTMPANIMFEKWADIGFEWRGELSTDELSRLSAQLIQSSLLQVTCRLYRAEQVLWLQYQVDGEVQLACQRCLEPQADTVAGEYRLALLWSEDDVAKINGAEYVLVDEVLTGEGRRLLPIKDLLEDELILALPLSPRHDDCELYVDHVGEEIEEEVSDNPFAALAALKGRLS